MSFSTKIFNTKNGAKVRVDSWGITCGWKNPRDGSTCTSLNKKFFFAEFKDPSGNTRRIAEILCDHLDSYWTTDVLSELVDMIHSGQKFKDIDAILRTKFPAISFPAPVIKRRPNGEYKEFDCPAKKKFEDLKNNTVSGDVWQDGIKCVDAYKEIKWPGTSFKGFSSQMSAAAQINCQCGHEEAFHKSGFCAECKKYC